MLSLFPQLLDWGWFVPFVFRICLGFYFFFLGYHLIRDNSAEKGEESLSWMLLGLLIVILSLSFLFGVYVQIAGVIGFVLSWIAIYFRYRNFSFTSEPIKYYFFVGIISLSLLFLGAGPHAFDLPL